MSRKRHHRLPVLGIRPCNGCTACCSVFGVRDLDKDPWTTCAKVVPTGCSIYETRPPPCVGFHCLWQGGTGTPDDRPDALGVIFAWTNGKTEFTHEVEVQAYEIVPNAFNTVRVQQIAKTFVQQGKLVVGHTFGGKTFRFMGPREKIAKAQRWVAANNGIPS